MQKQACAAAELGQYWPAGHVLQTGWSRPAVIITVAVTTSLSLLLQTIQTAGDLIEIYWNPTHILLHL